MLRIRPYFPLTNFVFSLVYEISFYLEGTINSCWLALTAELMVPFYPTSAILTTRLECFVANLCC